MILALVWLFSSLPAVALLGALAFAAIMDRQAVYRERKSYSALDRRVAHKEAVVFTSSWLVAVTFFLAAGWSLGAYFLDVPATAVWARRIPVLLFLFSGVYVKTIASIYVFALMRGVRAEARSVIWQRDREGE